MTDDAKRFGAEGGKKRAANLTRSRRKEIAQKAAEARWAGEAPVAKHIGELTIGDLKIPCAVLEDGTRVLTQWGFFRAIGRSGRPAAGRGSDVEKMAPFLDLDNLKPFVDKDLADSTKPVVFRLPSGGRAYGYRADLLPRVCEVYLRARDAGTLLSTQEKFAKACEIIVRGLAEIGIVALVDEATGYQAVRARDALAKILEAFVQKELRKWVRTFPAQYYEQMCRLRGVAYPPVGMKLPQYFGTLTNNVVYERLAPGVKDELKRLAPRSASGKPKSKLFQHLTEDVGNPKLLEHLASVTTLMKISPDWSTFEAHLDKALPKWGETLQLGLDDQPTATPSRS